jgi:hypothetical protein
MEVLVFSKHSRDYIGDLKAVAGTFASVIQLDDETRCKAALARCLDGETILIFCIRNEADMAFLEAQARQFIDMRLIICLETHDAELSARAYGLKPRLVLDPRASPALLPGVVKGILKGFLSYKKQLSI